jgi:PiT family inorganic phosphate transporter
MDFLSIDTGFVLLVVIVALALIFDYINGFHDAANAIATVVSTKALSPKNAVLYGAVLNFTGALLGTEVAATVGKGLVAEEAVTMTTVICALLSSILWNLFTWYKGLPTSSSHALIGSLLGATFFANDYDASLIRWDTFTQKVVTPMFTSPMLGFTLGFLIMTLLTWLVYRVHLQTIGKVFKKCQLVSAGFLALSHGHNDAQKSMGIIALALMTYYHTGSGPKEFEVPTWVILSCAIAMGLGTMGGGWKIIRTLGSKMIKLQPVHGFAAEVTGATIIMGASHFGIPLSTTQVISTSIMGVGATKRLSALKWSIVANIVWAWILTLPITFLLSGSFAWLIHLFDLKH